MLLLDLVCVCYTRGDDTVAFGQNFRGLLERNTEPALQVSQKFQFAEGKSVAKFIVYRSFEILEVPVAPPTYQTVQCWEVITGKGRWKRSH